MLDWSVVLNDGLIYPILKQVDYIASNVEVVFIWYWCLFLQVDDDSSVWEYCWVLHKVIDKICYVDIGEVTWCSSVIAYLRFGFTSSEMFFLPSASLLQEMSLPNSWINAFLFFP